MNVKTFNDLVAAIQNEEKEIVVTRSIFCNYSLMLPEGTTLKGQPQENGELPLLSFQHSDAIGIGADNTISDLNIDTSASCKAIFNTTVYTAIHEPS
jgi:hypothetical protein